MSTKPINANTKFFDKAVDRAAMVRLYERRINAQISAAFDENEQRLDKIFSDPSISYKEKERLFEEVDRILLQKYRQTFTIAKKSLIDLFLDQASFTYQNIEAAMGKIWNAERPATTIAEEIVLKYPLYKNQTLEGGWTSLATSERQRIESLIRKGIADNKTLDQIAVSIRKGSVYKISRAQSKGLVVTGVTSVSAQANQAVYKANEKAIIGWQYVAVLDSRTTPVCAHRNGHIYPVDDTIHLPPAHYYCRSTTTPVFKSWDDISKLEGVAQIRARNLSKLTQKEKDFYDGLVPEQDTYSDWLKRQPQDVKLRHLGDYEKVKLFDEGSLDVEKFSNPEGNSLGIRELRAITNNGNTPFNDTKRFALAREKLDALHLGASTPEDFINDDNLTKRLKDYYLLQAGDLEGNLSLTNYRGVLIGNKAATKKRVLTTPPREDQLVFNPMTRRYDDTRIYQPRPEVLENSLKLVDESIDLLDKDKLYIRNLSNSLEDTMSINERAAVIENIRILFTRYRKNPEPWVNFKAVSTSQIKFDVMNISDNLETIVRKDTNFLKKMQNPAYIDPVLGPSSLQDLHDTFISNIFERNRWEDSVAPDIARELRDVFDRNIPIVIRQRLSERDISQFYLRFAHRLSLADSPDRDQFAITLGRDLYNQANLNGSRNEWFKLGMKLIESNKRMGLFDIEPFGVQYRRMRSRMSGKYFGPKYETFAYNIVIRDKRLLRYAELNRKVEFGLRLGVTTDKNTLVIRPGFKTYFVDRGILGYEDTRIPITSSSSFSDFPEQFIDKNMADALNWASKAKYKVDPEFHNFVSKLLNFEDDKGKAKYYNDLNIYKSYMLARGDSYERFKAMEWYTEKNLSFSNHAFIDHRARIYERGLVGPQAGESFRPFLNTDFERNFSRLDFYNFQDQIGSFLGGLSDFFEGRYNSLSFTGRQKVAEKWRPELVRLGNHMLRAKPGDIRAVLESEMFAKIDGEDQGKFLRLAFESAKIDNYLKGNYSVKNLETLSKYKTALAMEQDASSSGAQIIALTTKNRQLAELSNVVPTDYKKRLYDEIAAATYSDPRFIKLNEKLGLSEKDLKKAAKAQNMVTFYGAGERTGALNVEGKLAKVLGKQDGVLVVKATERDAILDEISARMARYEKFDPVLYDELKVLRQNVRDTLNKGLPPGDDMMEQLYFLDSKTRDVLEKMSLSYDRVVTPNDFSDIAAIMSEHLAERVPILKDFTKFLGRLAEAYLSNAKPSESSFDWEKIGKIALRGNKKKGYILPARVSEVLGLKANEPISEKIFKRYSFWEPKSNLNDLMEGVSPVETRRTGTKILKLEVPIIAPDIKKMTLGKNVKISEVEIFYANKLPKKWTNVPWVNFDRKVLEQNYSQVFEERLNYQDRSGKWIKNILQVPQRTEAGWWDEAINSKGKINDIADITKARTAFAVNGNHSNDAVLVKRFHLWGQQESIPTSTIHDAFFTNITDMLKARSALKQFYADSLEISIIEEVLLEMRRRGLPEEIYKQYLNEAIDIGLIPVAGRSKINGKVLKESDILKREEILRKTLDDYSSDFGWYGVN